jgi:hypothetical protein
MVKLLRMVQHEEGAFLERRKLLLKPGAERSVPSGKMDLYSLSKSAFLSSRQTTGNGCVVLSKRCSDE